jgi:DNA-binding CsgD family transcriptional regulator
MEHLSNAQLRRALSAAQGLVELEQLEQLPAWSATALRELIPCDVASYNAVDPSCKRASVAVDPADCMFDGGVEALAHYIHQNPLASNYAATGDGRALRISDFISLRQLHATDLYDHVYRHIDLEHQLAITLPSPRRSLGHPGEMIGLTLSRSRRDFSDAERQLLECLRPHFAATLARLHELALLRAIHAGERDYDPRRLSRSAPLPGPEQLRALALTPRQAEVLAHALNGRTSAQIAAALGLSPRTVEKHFEGIYDRLGAANRAQAIATALQAFAGERARDGGAYAG